MLSHNSNTSILRRFQGKIPPSIQFLKKSPYFLKKHTLSIIIKVSGGGMKRAVSLLAIFLFSTVIWAQNRYALVIGNANYPNDEEFYSLDSTGVTPLPLSSANMVRIEGGMFTMGSPSNEPGRYSNEALHRVTVNSFHMGKYQVTQAEYEAVMGTNPSYFKGANLPVENVSWYNAIEYCNRLSQIEGLTPAYTIDKSRSDPNNKNDNDDVKWLVTRNLDANGYRLPTEAEWEYACRAGTTTRFWSGNDETTLSGKANVADLTAKEKNPDWIWTIVNIRDGYVETSPVGIFTPNQWGLYDMHGNVWEWCWDWYDDYKSKAQINPTGAASGSYRVLRGGSWFNYAADVRSAFRNSYNPSDKYINIGFRLVRQ